MNVFCERVSRPQPVSRESLLVLANWSKRNGPRNDNSGQSAYQLLRERYPAGLFSEAELEALSGVLMS